MFHRTGGTLRQGSFALGFLLLACLAASAQPRTLYKPSDIANARENVRRYKWAKDIVAHWERRSAFALKQDRAFFVEMIPDLTPGCFYGQNCPACLGKKSVMGEGGLFKWSGSKPDQIVCRRCGTVYPNPEYPETGTLECPRMGQAFTYYQTPEERALGPNASDEERGKHAFKWLGTHPTMTSFSGMVRYGRVRWGYREVLYLAKLYAVTENVAYAERAAWILDRFAEVFPKYLYHSYDGSVADLPPGEVAANMGDPKTRSGGRFPPEAIRHAYGLNQKKDKKGAYSTLFNGFWGAGRLSPHGKGSDAGPLLYMTIAYDLTRDATYPDERPVYDAAMRRRIRENLLGPGCDDMEYWDDLSNKGVATLPLSAAAGALLDRPASVHRAFAGFEDMLKNRYHFDGFYSESPAYAAHNYSNVSELPDLLRGYSDPPGYHAPDGSRLDDLRPYSDGRFSLALLSMVRQLAPGKRLPVIGDTAYDTRLNPRFAEVMAARLGGPYAGLLETVVGKPLSEWGSEYSLWYRSPDLKADEASRLPVQTEWFPGWHVAALRGGEAEDTALYLNGNEHRWTLRTGHRQCDILSLSYYGFGEELASDRGYFSGSGQRLRDGRSGQQWVRSTLSHNLVVVDEQDQARREAGSHLEMFGTGPGVEMVEASAFGAYPQCDMYRRTCAMIETPDGNHYVVDFFRVRGGKVHQYAFQSNGKLAQVEPGESKPAEIGKAWSKWVEHPRGFAPDGPSVLTWRSGAVGLDLTVLNDRETVDRIVIADAPGWRKGTPSSELDKPPVQQALVEHRGDGVTTLTTQYAAVFAAYREASPVRSARLVLNDAATGAMAVEVRLAGRTDIVVSTLDDARRTVGLASVAGRFAVVSLNELGVATRAYLLGGMLLECGGVRLSSEAGMVRMPVAKASGRTYHLAKPLPDGVAVPGAYILADGPDAMREGLPRPRTGFEIESATANTITVRDYPAVACEEITILVSRDAENGRNTK